MTSKPPRQTATKADSINIVGAGVFGLSTAIHLAQRGYTHITIFDKQPYDQTQYSYFQGCDAASADLNKIFRCAYGGRTEYQALSIEAFDAWKAWNAEIAACEEGNGLPSGMSRRDRVFINNGNLCMTDRDELPEFERATVRNMAEAGYPGTQLVTCDAEDVRRAEEKGFGFAVDPFGRRERGLGFLGVLDTMGGTILADKACCFALHKARSLGVRTVFGSRAGRFQSFITSSSDATEVLGIRTLDGKEHFASKTIMACGGWTPTLVPSLDSVCETTAGSVVILKLPKPLADRYSAGRFPAWVHNVYDGAEGGLYGFGATDEGYMKIGYRGTKYTNPKVQEDGCERSVPVTQYTEDQQITDTIPTQAFKVIKKFIHDFLPDLVQNGAKIDTTRLCWYTDSWDNHFVVDYAPEYRNLFVATAGSGHAFKYLPIVGDRIVDILEGKNLDQQLQRSWRWRGQPVASSVINRLMEGSADSRVLRNTEMSSGLRLSLDDIPRL